MNKKHLPILQREFHAISKTGKEYMDALGSLCPYCKSDKISCGDLVPSAELEVSLDITCKNCGKMWRDIYRLHEWEEIIRSEPKL